MLSYLANVAQHFFSSSKQNVLLEELEKRERCLQNLREEEQAEKNDNVKIVSKLHASTPTEIEQPEQQHCFKKTGVVTKLFSNSGVIDYDIPFDTASCTFNSIKVGTQLEYLAYKQPNTDYVKLVKILSVFEGNWDEIEPDTTTAEIDKSIEILKRENPIYFNTQDRSVLGVIVEKREHHLLIDIDYDTLNVNLNTAEFDFVPKVGDRVLAACKVQVDENFVDTQGEILEVMKVYASRLLKQERLTVRRLYEDYGVLGEDQDAYFTVDVLPDNYKPVIGDVVQADLVECEKDNFVWRCISLEPHRIAVKPQQLTQAREELQKNKVCFQPEKVFLEFDNVQQSREIMIKLFNNRSQPLHVSKIEISDSRLMQYIDPPELTSIRLEAFATYVLKFMVTPQRELEDAVKFVIDCVSFKLTRTVFIYVFDGNGNGNGNEQSSGYRKHTVQDQLLTCNARRNNRLLANEVWSRTADIVRAPKIFAPRRFVARKIPYYDVPSRLRTACLTLSNKAEITENVLAQCPCLQEPLNYKNYEKRFGTLLFLEEIETFLLMRQYDRERAHFTREGEYLSLQIENLAEKRPSLVLGDSVRVIDPWNNGNSEQRCYEGYIHKVLFDRILLKFNESFQSKYNGEDYRLEFFFSRFVFRKQHFSISRVLRNQTEDFLFPTRVITRAENLQLKAKLSDDGQLYLNDQRVSWFNEQLNIVQKRAVVNAIRGEAASAPYVIYGPPGTGKTITCIEIILQLTKNVPSARLIVATPSNSGANLITSRLIESGALQPGEFVRLVSQNAIEKDLIPDNLAPYCATTDMGIDGTGESRMVTTESGLKLRCQMKFLGGHRVTISTTNTISNFHVLNFPHNHFSHVIVDESAQCTETEVMMAISLLSSSRGQVILAGDPQQLQPIIFNQCAKQYEFGLSFLERLLQRVPYKLDVERFPKTNGFDPRLLTKLIYNYRALPSILNVYNELFYRGELLPTISEQNSRESKLLLQLQSVFSPSELRPSSHGAFFHGVCGENVREKDSPSWLNPVESKQVFLMTLELYRKNIKPENIGIITPYFKQVKHLRSMFIETDIAMPKIGSVEEFQGQERDIILISTVRSSKEQLDAYDKKYFLGFVSCRRRMNVAISRSRYMTIVFGNPHLLSIDTNWQMYIQYCIDNDAYRGCEPPADM